MASEDFKFFSDCGELQFSDTLARPPVPGEDNAQQECGGMSTGGAGPHSNDPWCKTTPNKCDISRPLAATPRKSNLIKRHAGFLALPPGADDEDLEAPLRFAPEGSAASSPTYSESSTPPHHRWAKDLDYLLSDSEGVAVFRKYLEQEQGGCDELQFWFACQGLKRRAHTGSADIMNSVRVIFKTYVRCEKVRSITKATKKEILDKLNKKSAVDQCVFDKAQSEVEAHMRHVSYMGFLNSDQYLQYVNNYIQSPKPSPSAELCTDEPCTDEPCTDEPSTDEPVAQCGQLAVLHEDKELSVEDMVVTGLLASGATPDRHHLSYTTPRSTETMVGCRRSGLTQHQAMCAPHVPYVPVCAPHVSYVPVSAQDSELQSVSSDALTDDALSLADSSSLDGKMTYSQRRYKKLIKRNALQNKENKTDLRSIIPRTEKVPKEPNLAETDPDRFAQLLADRLSRELQERETLARVEERLGTIRQGETAEEEAPNPSLAKHPPALVPMLPQSGLQEESAESILDFHCSRVWSSSQHSPSQSPQPRTLPYRSLDRSAHWSKSRQAHALNTTAESSASLPRPHHGKKDLSIASESAASLPRQHHAKKEMLSRSFDCGVYDEKGRETHKHIHHHYHHHHSKPHNACWRDYSAGDHGRGKTCSKKSSGRKSAGGNADTRLNTGCEPGPPHVVPDLSHPSNEKVMKWINDTVRGHKGTSSVEPDHSTMSRRTSRHSAASPSSQPHKHSSKSKASTHASGRTAVTEHGKVQGWGPSSTTLPSQPFVQDSSMPPPTPPHPTTQLEEAKRRLQETRFATPHTALTVLGREKVRASSSSPSQPPGASIISHPVAVSRDPADPDLCSGVVGVNPEHQPCRPAATGVSSSGVSSGGSVSSGVGGVVVGMYFDQEPIPYRFTVPGPSVTLAHIRSLHNKRGAFKYFFKQDSDEFGEGAVFEEITDDGSVVPTWKGKIVVQVQRLA